MSRGLENFERRGLRFVRFLREQQIPPPIALRLQVHSARTKKTESSGSAFFCAAHDNEVRASFSHVPFLGG